MKQLKIIILLIFIATLLCGCPNNEEGHRYIYLVNKSGKNIGSQASWRKIMEVSDSAFQCNMSTDYIIAVDSIHIFECSVHSSGWEKELNNDHILQFLIMDGDLFKQYFADSCDTIRKYVPILHRYQLTLKDLERMNWTVVYPPTEEMKDMKMYPPYQ